METCIYLQDQGVEQVAELPDAERLEIESAIAFHESQVEPAKTAGFGAQAQMHQRMLVQTKRRLLPAPPFQVISDAEYEVWCLFLPTSYSREQFADYEYDLIPPDVLETVQKCRHLFDKLEIRTPEEIAKTDPAIFGKRGDVRYLIARWAESRLPSFEVIKEQALKNLYKTKSLVPFVSAGIVFTAMSLLSFMNVFTAMSLLSFIKGVWGDNGILTISVIFGSLATLFWYCAIEQFQKRHGLKAKILSA